MIQIMYLSTISNFATTTTNIGSISPELEIIRHRVCR